MRGGGERGGGREKGGKRLVMVLGVQEGQEKEGELGDFPQEGGGDHQGVGGEVVEGLGVGGRSKKKKILGLGGWRRRGVGEGGS